VAVTPEESGGVSVSDDAEGFSGVTVDEDGHVPVAAREAGFIDLPRSTVGQH
jgi:hypothetical protein